MTGTLLECPLCGTRFTHGGRDCGECAVAPGCDLVRCPRCGYGFPRGSRVLDWLGALLRRLRGRPA